MEVEEIMKLATLSHFIFLDFFGIIFIFSIYIMKLLKISPNIIDKIIKF